MRLWITENRLWVPACVKVSDETPFYFGKGKVFPQVPRQSLLSKEFNYSALIINMEYSCMKVSGGEKTRLTSQT